MAEKAGTVRVTPTRYISGLIDGASWAAPGEPMDVSAASAPHLLEAGDVVPFSEKVEKVEKAAAPAVVVETATRKRG